MSCVPKTRSFCSALTLAVGCLGFIGCGNAPGRPGPGPEVVRPEEVLDFARLYKQNCSGCHGENGRDGPAISLSNPVYIQLAGETHLRGIIANGVPGKLMPPFAKSAGGGYSKAMGQSGHSRRQNSSALFGDLAGQCAART